MSATRPSVAGYLMVAGLALGGAPGLAGASLPAPFERYGEIHLLELLYPGQAVPSKLQQTALWKGEGAPRLLALVDRMNGHYEFAQFAVQQDKLALVARYQEPRSWDDCHGFDLAPYKVSADRTAIGLRCQTMVTGGTIVVLMLYLRSDETFQPIFARTVEYAAMESPDWSSAIIQVAPRKAAHNDLLVVESDSTGKTTRERWTWDDASEHYREVRQ